MHAHDHNANLLDSLLSDAPDATAFGGAILDAIIDAGNAEDQGVILDAIIDATADTPTTIQSAQASEPAAPAYARIVVHAGKFAVRMAGASAGDKAQLRNKAGKIVEVELGDEIAPGIFARAHVATFHACPGNNLCRMIGLPKGPYCTPGY